MNNKPLVSVRIPSYNHENYIHDCVSSVLHQTFQDFEIVIVDDCSTDGTVNEIRKFNDPRIKLEILERNSGMNVAVQRCMEHCTGKYVANISSDDMWSPIKLEKQVQFLENNDNYDAVFTQVEFIGENGYAVDDACNIFSGIFDYENRAASQWLRRFFYQGNCLCNPSVMIRRDVYKALNYQDKRLVSLSDFDLWIRFSMNHQLWILDEQLTKFRVRDGNMNLSADTPGNRNRGAFEYKQILDDFLLIKDPHFLVQIFPECLNFGEPKEIAIPYFLGKLAIDTDSLIHRLWGCEKIFGLMSDDKAAAFVEAHYDFRYNDFLHLTKTTDFFNILTSAEAENAARREAEDAARREAEDAARREAENAAEQEALMLSCDAVSKNQQAAYGKPLNSHQRYFMTKCRTRVFETLKSILKRINPRLFEIVKGIYADLK